MKRLTTDNPQDNIETMHNLVFAKDKWVYLRGMSENGEDIDLCDYIRQLDPSLAEYTNGEIDEIMCDEVEKPTGLIYFLAAGFYRVRERLAAYEDTGLTPERCAEIAQAEERGRLAEMPCKPGDTIYEAVFKSRHQGCPNNSPGRCKFYKDECDRKDKRSVIEREFSVDDYSLHTRKLRRNLYLTPEEAEAALKRSKNESV